MTSSPEVVPVQLSENSIIRIQATPIGSPVDDAPMEVGDIIESDVSLNLRPLKDVADAIEEIAQTVKTALDKVTPSKSSVEFSVEFGWEAGQLVAMIAQGEAKAGLKVSLEWGESE